MLAFFIILVTTILAFFISRIGMVSFPFKKRKKYLLLVIFFLCIGLFIIIKEGQGIQEGFQRKKWPTSIGEILQVEVQGGRAYIPEIRYRYLVKGISYTGITDANIPYFGPGSSRKEVAYKTISLFEKGDNITIYYNPNNPIESYLKPAPTWDLYVRLSLGIMLYGIMVGLILPVGSVSRQR